MFGSADRETTTQTEASRNPTHALLGLLVMGVIIAGLVVGFMSLRGCSSKEATISTQEPTTQILFMDLLALLGRLRPPRLSFPPQLRLLGPLLGARRSHNADGNVGTNRHTLADGNVGTDRHTLADGNVSTDRHTLADGNVSTDRHTLADGNVSTDCHTLADGTVAPAEFATPTTPTTYLARWRRIKNSGWIERNWPDFARALKATSWVQDGIDNAEAAGLTDIFQIEEESTARTIMALPWLQDGIEASETATIHNLVDIENKNAAEALRIVAMPFLEELKPSDAVAVATLADLLWFEPSTYQKVIAHPSLRGGITDSWAKIVAVLWSGDDRDISDQLLDLDLVRLQERTISLPHTGIVHLTIIRLQEPTGQASMDALEHATRVLEAYMGLPLPTTYVALVYADSFYAWDSPAGASYSDHIVISPEYDLSPNTEDWFPSLLIAHELAHYFWTGNSDWIDEGIAEVLAILIENGYSGRPIVATGDHQCAAVATIAALESRLRARGNADALEDCSRYLGEQLFLGLHRELGDSRFGDGLRRLYLQSQGSDGDLGIEQIRSAFKTGDGTLDLAGERVIDHWYGDQSS